jgi:hypothetical protein
MVYQIGGMRPWDDLADRRRAIGPRPISGFGGQFSGLMPQIVAAPPRDLVGTTAMPSPLVIRGDQAAVAPQEPVQLSIPGPQTTLAQTGRPVDWIQRAALSGARFAPAPEETVMASSVRPGFSGGAVPVAQGQIELPLDALQPKAARIAALAQELGLPEPTAAWLIDQDAQGPQAIRQAMGARNRQLAQVLQQRGTIPSARDAAGAPLGALIAQSGEVREDPLGRATRALNRRLFSDQGGTFMDEAGYERDLNSGAIVDRALASPTERPIDGAPLSADELAALVPGDARATQLPYAATALSPSETGAVFQESGASRTRGGRRNAFAKEPSIGFNENPQALYPGTFTRRSRFAGAADQDDRYAWFTPGSVMGAGMDPNPASATIPLLVAPRSQERGDQPGQFQAPSVYLRKQGGFVPALADARILDVNPLAQLSPAVADALAARLGYSFYAPGEPDKVVTGGYAGRATNAPIPDPATGGGGFDPIQDPAATGAGGAGGARPMTIAEAVAQISQRNLAPISPVMVDQLIGDGLIEVSTPSVDGQRAMLRRDGGIGPLPGTLTAAGLDRRPVRSGVNRYLEVYPLGMPSKAEEGLSPADVLRLRAQERGQDFVDARIGSRGRYGPGLYGDIDTLVGALAGEAFPDARAGFQVLNTASDLATKAPAATRDRFDPVILDRPIGDQWSLLVNTPSRDPLVTDYQNELLRRTGVGVTEEGKNPLLSLVGDIQSLAGVPVTDTALTPAAPAAQRVVAGTADPENALRLAKIRANQAARAGSSDSGARPNSFARRDYELNARAVLANALAQARAGRRA